LKRPRYRAECVDGPRPCPWVGCRYHLYLDVEIDDDGHPRIVRNQPGHPLPTDPSCALDVAEAGAHEAEDIAAILGTSPEEIDATLRRLHRLKLFSD